MLHVIATITVEPGKRAEFLGHFHAVVPHVRAEAGCIEYAAAVDVPTPIAVQSAVRADVVVVVEKWESLAHLQAHLGAPHMAEYRKAVTGLVKGVALQILEPAN